MLFRLSLYLFFSLNAYSADKILEPISFNEKLKKTLQHELSLIKKEIFKRPNRSALKPQDNKLQESKAGTTSKKRVKRAKQDDNQIDLEAKYFN